MVLLTDRVFTHLGTEPVERVRYWGGEDAEKFVRAIVEEAVNEAKARYEQLLRRAGEDYQRLARSLADVGRAEVIKQFAEVPPTIARPLRRRRHTSALPARIWGGWFTRCIAAIRGRVLGCRGIWV
jgi:hypothetical protein